MSTLVATLQGRFGNQATQWLFCYAFAQKHGMKFECEEWVGERVFDLPEYERPARRDFRRVNENEMMAFGLRAREGKSEEMDADLPDMEFRGYGQTTFCATCYTKRQAQEWLKLRSDIEQMCHESLWTAFSKGPIDTIVCHRRAGDYFGYSYPIVSLRSYYDAMAHYGLHMEYHVVLSEEKPTPHLRLPDYISFMADFYRMMKAPTLLRGNSTFSWLAAMLGNGLVLSPVIDGLEGGKEHDCRFVAGNHPRLANFDFTTSMYINP